MGKKQKKNYSQKSMEVFDEVQTVDQPFLQMSQDDKVVLVGDAKKTDSRADYVLKFIYPIEKIGEFDDAVKIDDNSFYVDRKIKKVFLTQEIIGNILQPASQIMLRLVQYSDLRSKDEYSFEELLKMNAIADKDYISNIRSIVTEVLNIDDEDAKYIELSSMIHAGFEIILENSSFFQPTNF